MGKWKYGIILDAGSSGTRIYIYRWLNAHRAREGASDKELHRLPELETRKEWIDKIHPGIATFGDKPELVGPDHLKSLFDLALDVVPKDEVEETPIFLLATAGMRLLEPTKRRMLLDQICKYAQTTTKFQVPDCDLHIQVIPGETEGLYGWIAANYLLGGFDHPKAHDHGKGHHTYGFLDMGGASAQIAFAPNRTEADKHANDLQLLRLRKINGEQSEFRVFVTTWLEFGVNEARRRYVEALRDASPSAKELPDPCLPAGLTVTLKGEPVGKDKEEESASPSHLVGTGKFDECVRQTYPLLDKDAPCPDAPCLLHGVHVPAIDFDVNHFVGVSEYWHTTHEIFEMSYKGKGYDFKTYQETVSQFCSQPWESIEEEVQKKKWGKKVTAKTAQEACFKASWLINVLHDGIGVPRVGIESPDTSQNDTESALDKAKHKGYLKPFQPVDKVHGVEVSWTLGKMVLYASSQIPPANDALAVGFGSNAVGSALPSDFQHAGGTPMPIDTTHHNEDNDGDWHETLFQDSPRRIPGFVIFLIIIIVALFIFCGRDRRNGALQRFRRVFGLSSVAPRKRRFGGLTGTMGKLFRGHSGPAYERVLEDGDAVHDFELPEVDSDNDHSDSSSGSSRVGRTSGWATPQIKAGFELTPAYVDSNNIIQQGAGLGLLPPSAIDRGGLMSRTDSRERLAADREKRGRSRNGSPTRMRSSMIGLKESVE